MALSDCNSDSGFRQPGRAAREDLEVQMLVQLQDMHQEHRFKVRT